MHPNRHDSPQVWQRICQVLSNISIIAKPCWHHESLSPIAHWLRSFELTSDFNDICPFRHFRRLRLESRSPILSSFPSLSTFSRALGLFCQDQATLNGRYGDYRTKYEALEIASPQCYEKDGRAGMPPFRKKSSEPRFQGKQLSRVFADHLFHWYGDKRKENNKPFMERNVINIFAYWPLLICYVYF